MDSSLNLIYLFGHRAAFHIRSYKIILRKLNSQTLRIKLFDLYLTIFKLFLS